MSRWNDPQVLELARSYEFNGRIKRALQAVKRTEADERNARTLPHKRRAYWRSIVPTDTADELTVSGACEWPWKTAYTTEACALSALHGMDRKRKGQGLHPYPCRGGHFHLGRLLRRANVAWKAVA